MIVPAVDPGLLARLCDLGRSRMGDAQPGALRLRRRVDVQPDCVRVSLTGNGEIRAFTLVYGLTEAASRRILATAIRSGRDLVPSDLAADGKSAAIYIGAVVGRPGSGPLALALARRHVADIIDRNSNVSYLFARGATDTGHSLLTRLKFQALPNPSEIYGRRADAGVLAADGGFGGVSTSARHGKRAGPT